jgi:hypothetical protein
VAVVGVGWVAMSSQKYSDFRIFQLQQSALCFAFGFCGSLTVEVEKPPALTEFLRFAAEPVS